MTEWMDERDVARAILALLDRLPEGERVAALERACADLANGGIEASNPVWLPIDPEPWTVGARVKAIVNNAPTPTVTDAMVHAALTKWFGWMEWDKSVNVRDFKRDMRAALVAALKVGGV